MDMLTPAGIVGISLHLFGLPLIGAGAVAVLVGLLAWLGIARAEGGRARLCAARLPALAVGLVVGAGMLAALLVATQSLLRLPQRRAGLAGVPDAGGRRRRLRAALLVWPLLALLRRPSGGARASRRR